MISFTLKHLRSNPGQTLNSLLPLLLIPSMFLAILGIQAVYLQQNKINAFDTDGYHLNISGENVNEIHSVSNIADDIEELNDEILIEDLSYINQVYSEDIQICNLECNPVTVLFLSYKNYQEMNLETGKIYSETNFSSNVILNVKFKSISSSIIQNTTIKKIETHPLIYNKIIQSIDYRIKINTNYTLIVPISKRVEWFDSFIISGENPELFTIKGTSLKLIDINFDSTKLIDQYSIEELILIINIRNKNILDIIQLKNKNITWQFINHLLKNLNLMLKNIKTFNKFETLIFLPIIISIIASTYIFYKQTIDKLKKDLLKYIKFGADIDDIQSFLIIRFSILCIFSILLIIPTSFQVIKYYFIGEDVFSVTYKLYYLIVTNILLNIIFNYKDKNKIIEIVDDNNFIFNTKYEINSAIYIKVVLLLISFIFVGLISSIIIQSDPNLYQYLNLIWIEIIFYVLLLLKIIILYLFILFIKKIILNSEHYFNTLIKSYIYSRDRRTILFVFQRINISLIIILLLIIPFNQQYTDNFNDNRQIGKYGYFSSDLIQNSYNELPNKYKEVLIPVKIDYFQYRTETSDISITNFILPTKRASLDIYSMIKQDQGNDISTIKQITNSNILISKKIADISYLNVGDNITPYNQEKSIQTTYTIIGVENHIDLLNSKNNYWMISFDNKTMTENNWIFIVKKDLTIEDINFINKWFNAEFIDNNRLPDKVSFMGSQMIIQKIINLQLLILLINMILFQFVIKLRENRLLLKLDKLWIQRGGQTKSKILILNITLIIDLISTIGIILIPMFKYIDLKNYGTSIIIMLSGSMLLFIYSALIDVVFKIKRRQ